MSNPPHSRRAPWGTRTVAIRTSLVLLLLWPFASMAQDKHIDVTVRQEGGVNKLVFLNSECPDRPNEKGCVTAESGNSPNISWRLDESAADSWVFSRLQFSPDGAHWGDASHPLQDCTVSAFDLDESGRVTGQVPSSRGQILANGRMLQIHDHNRETCTTHYRLYAMPVAGGAEIDSDPVIQNRGGGSN